MDFGRAFSFIFDDPDWVRKIVVISLVSLIPIVGLLVLLGWSLNITRRVIDRYTNPLPEMEFGEDLMRGLRGLAGVFIYTLPIFALFTVYLIAVGGAAGSADQNTAQFGVAISSLCFTAAIILYALILMLLVPAAMGNLEAKNELSAAFRIGEIFGLIRSAPLAYILVVAAILILSLVVPIGLVACIVGVIFTAAYQMAVLGYLYGAAYNEAFSKTTASNL